MDACNTGLSKCYEQNLKRREHTGTINSCNRQTTFSDYAHYTRSHPVTRVPKSHPFDADRPHDCCTKWYCARTGP